MKIETGKIFGSDDTSVETARYECGLTRREFGTRNVATLKITIGNGTFIQRWVQNAPEGHGYPVTVRFLSCFRWLESHDMVHGPMDIFGGFLKYGYPEIINSNWIGHYKPSIWGYPPSPICSKASDLPGSRFWFDPLYTSTACPYSEYVRHQPVECWFSSPKIW